MKSSRPYLARALYEWLLDNELTPHFVVDATQSGVEVPEQFVQNGQIVLNAAPTAVRDLHMENDAISFHARFGGKPMQVMIPIDALVALYARENGVGMVFGQEPVLETPEAAPSEETASGKPERALSSVSDEDKPSEKSAQKSESVQKDTQEKGSGAKATSNPKKKRPTLRVVK